MTTYIKDSIPAAYHHGDERERNDLYVIVGQPTMTYRSFRSLSSP